MLLVLDLKSCSFEGLYECKMGVLGLRAHGSCHLDAILRSIGDIIVQCI